MPALFGPLLTNTARIEDFIDYYRTGRFSAAKVVTGWGVNGGWDDDSRKALTRVVPRLVVRSTAGDPSYTGAPWWLSPDHLVAEFEPWVRHRPDSWLELGNEPDVAGSDEGTIWAYRYYLEQAITRLRREFPKAKLIAPSPRVGITGWERWIEVCADQTRRCETVSAHIYGWHRINVPASEDTGQYMRLRALYDRLFPGMSVAVTEVGIHNPELSKWLKLHAYRSFAQSLPYNWRWVLFYHVCDDQAIQPEYHIPRSTLG